MEKILYGAAYYPEYMPYDRVDEDIKMMSDAGMNVVRIAESTWSTLEPKPGVYNFEYIDRTLDAVHKAGMYAIIGTPTYATPSWLVNMDKDVMVMRSDGQAKYGYRQSMDITNKTFLKYAENIIRVLVEHTARHPAVIGFQIDNETKHYGTVSDNIQAMFKEHLKKKFKTTDALNKAYYLAYWSNSIADWDDLPDMKGCINAGLASEFESFQRTVAADYLKWQSDIVSEYKTKEQFITHNFDFDWKKFGADIAHDGNSYGVQKGINHYEASDAVTIAGTDIYHPTQDELTGAEIAYGGDSIRPLKYDNYYVIECQAQGFKYWTPYPGQMKLHAYSHIANGADAVMYWNWHSIHNGYETYWRGVLSHDLMANPVYEECSEIGNEWKKIGKDIIHLKKENRAALVTDSKSQDAFKWFPIDKDLSYNDVVRWLYDSLYELNVECDIVDINELEADRYKMIITPVLYCVSEEKMHMLKRFVEDGGVLVSTFKSFVADENLSVYNDMQPHGMTKCFGMTYNQFTEPVNLTVGGADIKYHADLLKVTDAEAVDMYEHKYWGKYAGITKNHYKNGTAYYIGCFTTKDKLKQILKMALKDAEIEKPEFEWPVIIRSGINQFGKKVHFILHYSQDCRTIKCPYDAVTDIRTGKEYVKGDEITLSDWDVVVLLESDLI